MKNILPLCLFFALFPLGAADFLRNPGFVNLDEQQVPQGWTLRDTKVKTDGPDRAANHPAVGVKDNVLKLDTDGGKFEVMLIHFKTPLKAGKEYNFSYSVRGEGKASYRAVSQWTTKIDGKDTWKGLGGNWLAAPTAWENKTVNVKLPDDAREVYFYFAATGPGVVEIKDVGLREPGVDLTFDNELKIYEPGQSVNIELTNLKNPNNTLSVEIKDYLAKTVETKDLRGPGKFTFTPPGNGYFAVTVKESDAAGKVVATQTKTLAVIPPVPNPVRQSAGNQFGAMVNPHTHYPIDQKTMDAKFMNRIGVAYVRTHRLNWVHAQKAPDAPIDWTMLDEEVALYQKYGIKIVATTGWPTPLWAADAKESTISGKTNTVPKSEYMEQHRQFYTELAKRYRGKIAYYEIGNEVDASNYWLGKFEHAKQGDDQGILQDYIDYYIATAKAIKAGDPNAIVGPGTTGAMPDGHTYKPWMEKFWGSPAINYTDIFCTHYSSDLKKVHESMRQYGNTVPVVMTEIGGLVHTETYETTPENLRKVAKLTYVQFAAQLNDGGLALCKFLLRRIPEVKEGWISEMLDADYTIRPEYVAYATLIRMTGDGKFAKELNITGNVDSGWLQGYQVRKPDGKTVNIIMLNDSPRGKAKLKTDAKELVLTDEMGNSQTLTPINGAVELMLQEDLPIFITGIITENPGTVKHPEPQLVSTKRLTLVNGDFEAAKFNGVIPGWGTVTDETNSANSGEKTFTVELDRQVKAQGAASVRLASDQQTKWYGILCQLPMSEIPNPKPGEYVIFKVTYQQKGENIVGTGAGLTLGFRADDMRRVSFGGGNWDKGTFDWQTKTFVSKPYTSFHKDCKKITLEFYLGVATGKVWIDDVKVEVELWRKSNADANYIN